MSITESVLRGRADWSNSRKIRIGDKWLLLFWRGAVLLDGEPDADRPATEKDTERYTHLWNSWYAIPRLALTPTREVLTAGPESVRCQEFTTQSEEKHYITKAVLSYLPKGKLLYWHPKDSVLVLVTDKNGPIAVFTELVPNAPVTLARGEYERRVDCAPLNGRNTPFTVLK